MPEVVLIGAEIGEVRRFPTSSRHRCRPRSTGRFAWCGAR